MGKVLYIGGSHDEKQPISKTKSGEKAAEFTAEEKTDQRRKGEGRITKKPGSDKLYVDFYYFGYRIVKSLGLYDTPDGRRQATEWLDRQMKKIAEGTFRFSEAFPGATDEEKRKYSELEGFDYHPEPHRVLFGDYVKKWKEEICSKFDSEIKKGDFEQVIDDRLLPYFENKTFYQISGVEIKKFISSLKWRTGKREGENLSRSRIRNILIPLRAIWSDACEEHRWDLSDPFKFARKHIPKGSRVHREVFRFEDWMKILETMPPFYRPVSEVFIMTGMIGSEIAGLRRQDIEDSHILIQNSIVRTYEKDRLKTEFRERRIPITTELRKRLDAALAQSPSEYVFSMKSGRTFDVNSYRKNAWTSALKKAGVPYKVPYTTRHSFAAWALTLGFDPNRLVRLMGHSSKKMIYEVYGNYVEGLEKDAGLIKDYFGNDFNDL